MDVKVCAILHKGAGLGTVVLVVDPCMGTGLLVCLPPWGAMGPAAQANPPIWPMAMTYAHTEDPWTMGYIYKALVLALQAAQPSACSILDQQDPQLLYQSCS